MAYWHSWAVVVLFGVNLKNFLDVEHALVRTEASILPFAADFATQSDIHSFVGLLCDFGVLLLEFFGCLGVSFAFYPPGFSGFAWTEATAAPPKCDETFPRSAFQSAAHSGKHPYDKTSE